MDAASNRDVCRDGLVSSGNVIIRSVPAAIIDVESQVTMRHGNRLRVGGSLRREVQIDYIITPVFVTVLLNWVPPLLALNKEKARS